MIDTNIKKTLKELEEILHHKALQRLNSHLSSLMRDIGRLRTERDKWRDSSNAWKKEAEELKERFGV